MLVTDDMMKAQDKRIEDGIAEISERVTALQVERDMMGAALTKQDKRIAELEALLREGSEGVSQTWDGIMPVEDMVDWVKRADAALKTPVT